MTTTPRYNYRSAVPMTYANYRPTMYSNVTSQHIRAAATVTDDYERWYTEAIPNNRMVMALRCGIHGEISWALDRLCRLCNNDQFILKSIPGLTPALFEWPEWFLKEYAAGTSFDTTMFSTAPDKERKTTHALNSIFILRNASLNDPNAMELAANPRVIKIIMNTLNTVTDHWDVGAEFLLHTMELLQTLISATASSSSISPVSLPLQVLEDYSNNSQNRSMIIACLAVITRIIENPLYTKPVSAESPALAAALRYLPLFVDKILVDASLNYLYAHLSHSAMTKAFLLHPLMPSTLKLLVSLLLSEQVEETVTVDIGEPIRTASAVRVNTVTYELKPDEKEALASKPEPERCYEWMKAMFIPNPESEMTQVNFWNLYKDTFTPYQDKVPLLVASEVIKNVSIVYSTAQAMVLPGPPQKFIVRGVDRRQEEVEADNFKCQWDRSKCMAITFQSARELLTHVRAHLDAMEGALSCLWSTCPYMAPNVSALERHVLTHLTSVPHSSTKAQQSQPERVTLSTTPYPHPTATPTQRPIPPPPRTSLTYRKPTVDPSSSSLTALLIIRLLFQASFAETEAAPRADGDHFGFPWAAEEKEEQEWEEVNESSDKEGQIKGKRAFVNVRKQMEGVRIREPTLMSWITEMTDAGLMARE